MLNQALIFLLQTALGFFSLALLLRFYLQLLRAPYRNPVSHFLAALTNFIVLPARRVIPGLWGSDLATLVLAWLAELTLLYATLLIKGHAFPATPVTVFAGLGLAAALQLAETSVYILITATLIQVALSWVNPHSPLMPLASCLADPFLRRFQKRIPPIGNVDLSPFFLVVACQLTLMLMAWLDQAVAQLF